MADIPKKYTKINGIMKLNPDYKRWKEAQKTTGPTLVAIPVTTVKYPAQALPIVSSMEDYEKMNEDLDAEIPLAEATFATIEMLQEPEIAAEAGMQPDDMIDELGKLLVKYEIPIGMTNKLICLSEYQSLVFIIDDSGSMSLQTDTIDPATKIAITRWTEAQTRLKEMIEVIAYVPFEQIDIEFLNRKDRIVLKREGRTPKKFLKEAFKKIDKSFTRKGPSGSTPALEKLTKSLQRGHGQSIARYFFGDGKPNGGRKAIADIVDLLQKREDPELNPVTFISCTNEDEAVEWMKDAEEVAPYCSESDDFNDEADEVLRDQGVALPFSKGFHLICQLVAAMNPDDLDAMDESIPFTKYTLDNLLGFVSNDESYRHYFDCFQKAQRKRKIEIDRRTGEPNEMDIIRKNTKWDYDSFLRAQGASKSIKQVVSVQKMLRRAAGIR